MLNVCSPTWLTQPPTTWPTARGIDARALDRGELHDAEQVGRVHGREAAVAAPERRAHRFDDDDVGVGECGHGRLLGISDGGCAGIVVPVCENRPVPNTTRSTVVALLVAASLVLGACSDDGDDDDTGSASTPATTDAPDSETTAPDEPATTATAPATTTPPETTPPCPPLEGGTVEPTESSPPTGPPTLTGVAITSGDCTDVVTFTFTVDGAGAPGYRSRTSPGRSPRRFGRAGRGRGRRVPRRPVRARVRLRLRSRRPTPTPAPTASPRPARCIDHARS